MSFIGKLYSCVRINVWGSTLPISVEDLRSSEPLKAREMIGKVAVEALSHGDRASLDALNSSVPLNLWIEICECKRPVKDLARDDIRLHGRPITKVDMAQRKLTKYTSKAWQEVVQMVDTLVLSTFNTLLPYRDEFFSVGAGGIGAYNRLYVYKKSFGVLTRLSAALWVWTQSKQMSLAFIDAFPLSRLKISRSTLNLASEILRWLGPFLLLTTGATALYRYRSGSPLPPESLRPFGECLNLGDPTGSYDFIPYSGLNHDGNPVDCLKELVSILSSSHDQNRRVPILIGEAGVGKSFLVRALVSSNQLKGKYFYQANTADAAQYSTGEIRSCINSLQTSVREKVVLFLDEFHTVIEHSITKGDTEEEKSKQIGKLANSFKTLFTESKNLFIAATTKAEYEKYIKGTPLDQRLQRIEIQEPSPGDLKILLRNFIRSCSNLTITNEALTLIVQQAEAVPGANPRKSLQFIGRLMDHVKYSPCKLEKKIERLTKDNAVELQDVKDEMSDSQIATAAESPLANVYIRDEEILKLQQTIAERDGEYAEIQKLQVDLVDLECHRLEIAQKLVDLPDQISLENLEKKFLLLSIVIPNFKTFINEKIEGFLKNYDEKIVAEINKELVTSFCLHEDSK